MEEEIKKIATSIQKEFEIEIDNRKIICEFCNEFEKKIKSPFTCLKWETILGGCFEKIF